jgi:hypothetical protein
MQNFPGKRADLGSLGQCRLLSAVEMLISRSKEPTEAQDQNPVYVRVGSNPVVVHATIPGRESGGKPPFGPD